MDLLKEIQNKLKAETRAPELLYRQLKQIGTHMFLTNEMSRETVVAACVCLIGLYEALSPKNREEAEK